MCGKFETQNEISLKDKFRSARLYCITCPPVPGRGYEEMTEQLCRGGADVVQFREKDLNPAEMLAVAKKLQPICRRYETLFIVNDRLDVALSCGADGVHLGQGDLPLLEAGRLVQRFFSRRSHSPSPNFLIGCSTHSLEQAWKAQEEGADYVGCGPVFATPTKPNVQPVGLDLVRQYRSEIEIPFVAIGGIDETNVGQVIQSGAQCVAVVRAVCGRENIESAARSLKSLILSKQG